MAKDRITAGPALAAPTPVSVRMPVPTIAPTPERDQMRPAEAPLQPVLGRHVLVGHHRLAREQVHIPSPLLAA